MARLTKLPARSPGGMPTCPGVGPMDADVVLVAESPASEEIRKQVPLVGRSGRLLDQCLTPAGLRRGDLRIVNCIPAQAPGNDFSKHAAVDVSWGQARLAQELSALEPPRNCRRIIVCLGSNPMQWLAGIDDRITLWRGSLLPPASTLTNDPLNEYWMRFGFRPLVDWQGSDEVAYMLAFHPSAVLRQMEWHIWLLNDLKRAGRWTRGQDFPRAKRRWYLDNVAETTRFLRELLARPDAVVAIDTEMTEPPITALVSDEEVHSFRWHESLRTPLQHVMASDRVVKVAHNMAHDWRQFEKVYGIEVRPPWADTIAYAHAFEPGGSDPSDRAKRAGTQLVGKALSPHISSRYTAWPYHKWLVEHDKLVYCAIDTVVCYDAYVAQLDELTKRPELEPVLDQDHRLFETLFRAASHGVLIDQAERLRVEKDLEQQVTSLHQELELAAWPFIEDALDSGRLKKPHLFRVTKQCKCCGGGASKTSKCWSCAGFDRSPTKAMLLERFPSADSSRKKAELEADLLGTCVECSGAGNYDEDLGLNLDSSDQVADLLYRALRIPSRRYQGSETVRFEQLERLLEPGGYLEPYGLESRADARAIVSKYVELSKLRADLGTVARLTPGADGRLRTTFDLWYTPTHRVASRESLLDVGTNMQNIPKPARRFCVADPGCVFLYPDYAQIEGRAQAVLSQDAALLEIYRRGGDSHLQVAKLVQEECGLEITRPQAKRLSFAAFYDIEAPHLAEILGITQTEALQVLRAFFQVFRGAQRYKQSVEDELRLSRSCTSPTGWRRRWLGYVLETNGRNKGKVRDKIRKEALASGPQNIAAWVMAEGLLGIDEAAGWIHARRSGSRPWILPLVHVHDSVLLQVERSRAQEAIHLVESKMRVDAFGIDFPATCLVGPDWLTASKDDDEKPVEWQRSTWAAEA